MSRSMSVCSLVLLVAGALLLPPAAAVRAETSTARVYDGISQTELRNLLQKLGYRAQALPDAQGHPRFKTQIGGLSTYIRGYNCRDGSCNNLHFKTGLNLKRGATLEQANEYNRRTIFGSVYLDKDGDPWLEMTCNVADGVTAGNIEYTIERYSQALDAFARQFNFRR